jgi:hypothetical protein
MTTTTMSRTTSATTTGEWPTQLQLPGQAAAPDGPVDVAMMYLMQKADDDERATLVAMEAEHAHIDPLLTACSEAFRTQAAGLAWPVERTALAVHLADARDTLGRHLAHEERDAMRILQRHLGPAEWDEIEAHFAEGVDKRQLLALVPWLAPGLPEPAGAGLFATAGRANLILWRLTHRSFERLDARAFYYGPQ